MDFFARQDQARRSTKVLVIYFVLAVAMIILSIYVAAVLIFNGTSSHHRYLEVETVWWDPKLFLGVAVATVAVVAIGSGTKTMQLAAGGSAVANSLGGRLVAANTHDPDERKYLNVVEEMALASGVPMPQVFVLDDEDGINAFAAGHSPSDAAVCVTRGCLRLLNRDELQGVIGHEFSHILNGDMRLNIRLMGTIFGIVCLATIGRMLLYARSGRRDRNPLPLLGLALLIIGGLGVFFGRLIQSAVSRQREFLADASAVQFTRNPAGLAGALRKIGGLAEGSRVENAHASEASHMFFENALGQPLFSWMATHPPLEQRIRALDPGWDGKFTRVDLMASAPAVPRGAPAQRVPPFIPVPQMPPVSPLTASAFRADDLVSNIGNPTPLHLRYAETMREAIPDALQVAARDPFSAVALIYALLLSADEVIRGKQLQELARQANPEMQGETAGLFLQVSVLPTPARLPLVNLALPALRQLRPAEFQQFNLTLKWLVESDRRVDLFEYVLQKIVRRHLAQRFGGAQPPKNEFYSLRPLLPDCGVILSALAQLGSADDAAVQAAFRKGLPYLRAPGAQFPLLPRAECGLPRVDAALTRLSLATPQIKKNLLEACVQVVGADGVVQEREAELLRAIGDTLDCPIPPFVKIK